MEERGMEVCVEEVEEEGVGGIAMSTSAVRMVRMVGEHGEVAQSGGAPAEVGVPEEIALPEKDPMQGVSVEEVPTEQEVQTDGQVSPQGQAWPGVVSAGAVRTVLAVE